MAYTRPSAVWNTASGMRRSGEVIWLPTCTSSASTAYTSTVSGERTSQNRTGLSAATMP